MDYDGFLVGVQKTTTNIRVAIWALDKKEGFAVLQPSVL
jgi:hypothetical protein